MVLETHMRVSLLRGDLMQIQQSLVDVLLQLKSALHSGQSIVPHISIRFLKRKGDTSVIT